MFKLTFIGAGSTIFAKNVIGDILITPELKDYEIALFDIDPTRLDDSYQILSAMNKRYGERARILTYADRKKALDQADFIVNAIQVGGYEPATVTDFEIPKRFGLRQTIGDTLGIGGIFRALRTIPVLEEIALEIKEVCPNALFLNYTNPMAILTGYLERYLGIRTIGLCHSVQACVPELFRTLEMDDLLEGHQSTIAGINHQAWLLNICDQDGTDLYPLIKTRSKNPNYDKTWDLVRHDMMDKFGYYLTESSEHTAEYVPFYIKSTHPELIERFHIPLDEYPRRCEQQIRDWNALKVTILQDDHLEHVASNEYALSIIKAVIFNEPVTIHGNVMNQGFIPNLPKDACVEVPCTIDQTGIHPHMMDALPHQCAALNMTNINVQLLTMEGAYQRNKSMIAQAAFLDPHTGSELSMDEIKSLVDALFDAHHQYLPPYKEMP